MSALAELDFAARRIGLAELGDAQMTRAVPVEAPVALEYNGIGYAVMMATPTDLAAFATGFSLSEGLITQAEEIVDIDVHEAVGGWVVRVTLPTACADKVFDRARTRVSESSCGLCGIESIEQVLRPLSPITTRLLVERGAIAWALASLADHQPLGHATGAVHAAAFCAPDGRILHACEDVGRHNALDKLIGALALAQVDPASGFILLSARCSYELVEKTVRAGCPVLVTISAPTSLAVEHAVQSGLTLVSLARRDSALVLNDPHGSIS